jgi:hypothetical protein
MTWCNKCSAPIARRRPVALRMPVRPGVTTELAGDLLREFAAGRLPLADQFRGRPQPVVAPVKAQAQQRRSGEPSAADLLSSPIGPVSISGARRRSAASTKPLVDRSAAILSLRKNPPEF